MDAKRKLRIPVLCIAALALILGAMLLKPAPQPVKAESAATTAPFVQPITAPDPGTPEWFATATEPQNGMPFVTILFNSNPLYAINDTNLFGDQPGWYYTCYLTETSGQPFTIRNLRLINFMDHKNDIFDYPGEQVSGWFGSSTIPAHGQYSFTGGFSMTPEVKGIGFSVTGVTEDGTEMEFHSYLTLVAELSE